MVKKKVAILTQPLGHNYGGLLQAYALQTYLKKLGCEVETLDRRAPEAGRVSSAKSHALNLARLMLGRIKSIPTAKKQTRALEELANFRDRRITISPRITSEQELREYYRNRKFDAFVVGSDQVWRPRYSPSILNFFLNFLDDLGSKAIRVAYAASFGVDEWEYPENVKEKCRPLVKKFDAVSVREKSAIELCKTKFGINPDWVVDPTLLLAPSDYEALVAQDVENEHNSLVLSYILDSSEDKQKISKAVAEILQIDSLYIMPEKLVSEVRSTDIEQCIYPSVEAWLKSFREAQFVVTDSFHGTVFAILFNRPFIAVGNSKRGLARFNSLLSMLGLEDRLVSSVADIAPEIITDRIDWGKVNELREEYANEGRKFLKNHLLCGKAK
ncbi:polysaccharide pyruvyl transferase family protein [Marinobacter sp. X15-166B]|uniref:polysaccharide pyruvyl transferase family protein n=1 Tax=Marinobacter sp. X15-166B TaxID=1897620 RepID=UPI00085C9501|nr:polysaccharide pyruvyl transferase family protein [Marinobacter sp. X15-166B]OEY65160.1 hypothetical protein BG841_00880 [Marinobacter sp. X15-166B]